MAGHHERTSYRNAARRGLRERLRKEDPDYVPPPYVPPSEARREKWLLFGIFCAVVLLGAAGIGLGIL